MKKMMPVLTLFGLSCLVGCAASDGNGARQDDPTGVYTLVSVNGAGLPASVEHGDVPLKVHSGSFTINTDGTCSSKTVFGPPSGDTVTREVKATYTRTGSRMQMQWQGAGRTEGTLRGDTFSMNNEGLIFSYKR